MNNNRNISWQYVNRSRCMICQSLSIRWISRDFKLFSSAPGSGPIPISPYFGPSEGLVNVFLRVYRNMNLGCSHRHLPTMHGIWIWIDMIWWPYHDVPWFAKDFFLPNGKSSTRTKLRREWLIGKRLLLPVGMTWPFFALEASVETGYHLVMTHRNSHGKSPK